MPPILAFSIIAAFVAVLFWRDVREKPNVTGALWIPILWFLIIGSRTVAQWLQLGVGITVEGSNEEGTPVDAASYFVMIVAGAYVLYRRRIHLGEIVRNNRWLAFFLVYCFIAILWSDFPFVAFKRWIKILGHPIMTLVLFTEPDPEEAITRMMKRCAYLIIPFSILFIKWYPQWGRTYSPWGGTPMLTGVTLDKNTLGSVCFIFGLFFFCQLLKTLKAEKSRWRRDELWLCVGFLALTGWVLNSAKSSTSNISLIAGIFVVLFLGLPFINRRNIAGYVIFTVIILGALEMVFGVSKLVIEELGKDPTLTDRMPLWREVLSMQPNMIFGAGFESFWLGERCRIIWSHHWWQPKQAHNGYIETYLNLGLIGLFMMIALILSTFSKGCNSLLERFEFGRFRLGFLAAFILYNWTEAAFKALHPVWFVFYIVAMDYPQSPPVAVEKSAPTVDTGMPAEPGEV